MKSPQAHGTPERPAPREIDCLVLTPVGPRLRPEYVADTVDSFRHYMPASSTVMLVLDDSRSDAVANALPAHDNVLRISACDLVAATNAAHNTRGLLLLKQMAALTQVARTLRWRCLLRLDDDALFTGPSPHLDALSFFEANPQIGMLGAYLRRGDGTDKRPALAKQSKRLLQQIISRTGLRNPRMSAHLLRLIRRARRNGYRLGHMCTGGALFLSQDAWDGVHELWMNGGAALSTSKLADDLLLALYTQAAGYRLHDFSDIDQVMAINWRGLPMPLDELVQRGKKIVHPVKEPADPEHEARVREYFRIRRAGLA